ncbi:hypothetical protein Q3G72_015585 [Acer saccharum]|nr:hypothetical protein Q3G72_015585 [Acer saccharum]
MACSIGGGVHPSEPEVVAELPSKLVLNKPSRLYIVESAGALLIISRFVYNETRIQRKSSVYDEDDGDDDDDYDYDYDYDNDDDDDCDDDDDDERETSEPTELEKMHH